MGDADANGDPSQSFWYIPRYDSRRDVHIYKHYWGGKKFLHRNAKGVNREKKQNIHSFQKKERKKKKEKRKERREIRGSTQCLPYLPVQYLLRGILSLSLVLAFIPLLPIYRHTDRSRPIFCLYLALTYMDLLSRTVLSVELDEIQNTETM